jgi:hypothetical protein
MFPSILLIISIDMDQQQPLPGGSHMAPDGQQYQQQQPQWQPQQQQQQPMQMQMPMQKPQAQQPQYAQIPAENTQMPMQMPMQNASTPQLDTMYSQGVPQQYEQPVLQENVGYGQQGFVQQPQGFVQQPQIFNDGNNVNVEQQQVPQNFAQQFSAQEYQQKAQFDPSMNPSAQPGQFLQEHQPVQQQQAPSQAGYQFVQEGAQPAWPGSQPVNTGNVEPHADAPAWEQAHVTEVNDNVGFNRQQFAGGPQPPTSQQQQQTQAMRELELQNARQRIEALEAEREQQEVAQALAASARDAPDSAEIEEQLQQQIHQAQLLSLDAWEQEVRWKLQQQQGQMPPPPIPSARDSVWNLGFRSPTPRSQTPTRGVPLSDAARNAAAEDAQRWEAYHRGLDAHDGASVSARSEYTVMPEYSEASTARGGSKGKGRMP